MAHAAAQTALYAKAHFSEPAAQAPASAEAQTDTAKPAAKASLVTAPAAASHQTAPVAVLMDISVLAVRSETAAPVVVSVAILPDTVRPGVKASSVRVQAAVRLHPMEPAVERTDTPAAEVALETAARLLGTAAAPRPTVQRAARSSLAPVRRARVGSRQMAHVEVLKGVFALVAVLVTAAPRQATAEALRLIVPQDVKRHSGPVPAAVARSRLMGLVEAAKA